MGLRERWKGHREHLPTGTREALALGPGERLLAWTLEDGTGAVVAATTQRLRVLDPAGGLTLQVPWHEVQHGVWDPEASTLRVELVGAEPTRRWSFSGEPRALLQTLLERVQASVVVAEEVEVGPRRRARVAVRQDLATGRLLEQVVPSSPAAAEDPQVRAAAAEALARLRDDVGLT